MMSTRDRIELSGPYATAPEWRWPGEPENAKLAKYSAWSYGAMSERIVATTPHWEPVAKIHMGGVLVRNRATGRLMEHCGDRLCGVNERKALAALSKLARAESA